MGFHSQTALERQAATHTEVPPIMKAMEACKGSFISRGVSLQKPAWKSSISSTTRTCRTSIRSTEPQIFSDRYLASTEIKLEAQQIPHSLRQTLPARHDNCRHPYA